ncbi:NAD-dependent epimerase/dehydratase family protein [Candidatus Pelagibacter communis]|uniref:NAD-dependent epimerase/dehydratase family protein n=1 Tax=Pelagibacter ubique TaxID=198252 RepID=UPI00094C1185|nr:NAD-dependent epimerase/dehydratase family protein [Candidatus Pelagibacter ubique]|tara:strand:+ start:2126 stop:3094 length:969 start_codon:yes stop_codon:yes gene_type:complete
MIKKKSRIFIAGHNGLVGSSVLGLLKKKNYSNLIIENKRNLDLRNYHNVDKFFKKKKIEFLIICAARVGGIMANSKYPTEFLLENLQIQNNLLTCANKYNLKRTIFLGSSCIYPKYSKTPIKENNLLNGKLEKTNEAYALAKIAGIKLSQFIYSQYGKDIICLMPTNIYGTNDNFQEKTGHVIPGLITKFLKAKRNRKDVEVLGTGKPLREFLHVDDLSNAIYVSLKISKKKLKKIFDSELPLLNVGTGQNISIKNLANLISKIINFKGKILFNKQFPDGTYKKNLDSRLMRKLGWSPKIKLKEGLEKVISKRYQKVKRANR